MGAQNAVQFFKRGTLLITPGDREDILLAAGAMTAPHSDDTMAGIVLTGGLRPGENVIKALQTLPVPSCWCRPTVIRSRPKSITSRSRRAQRMPENRLDPRPCGPAHQREKNH